MKAQITSDMLQTLASLEYPKRQKATLFTGTKKIEQDYDNKLGVWNAVFASFRRMNHSCPTIECKRSLLVVLNSEVVALKQHALVLLAKIVSSATNKSDPSSVNHINDFANEILAQCREMKSKFVKLNMFICTYLIRLGLAIVNNTEIPLSTAIDFTNMTLELLKHPQQRSV
jgi:hypothetical protein